MVILGIESTADETALCLLKDGKKILTHSVASSLDLHRQTKGIVPEVSSRAHLENIFPILIKINNDFDIKLIDKVAVAVGPGLHGSLLVGVEVAKMLSYLLKKPLIPVNHLQAHLFANFIEKKPKLPALGLVVSGGHTDLVFINKDLSIKKLGATLDDAAGEAYDKVARVLLDASYPGGPQIDNTFESNRDKMGANILPRPMLNSADYNFSFSGLKTAVINNKDKYNKKLLAVDFQEAVVEVLLKKVKRASHEFKVNSIIIGGGDSSNSYLREVFIKNFNNIVYFPPKGLSLDNAVTIASAAYNLGQEVDLSKVRVLPSLTVEENPYTILNNG